MPEPDPVVVIGAGPAGLTAAWQLVKNGRKVIVLEADPVHVGGISRTVEYNGFRFDIGGHRFFSKSKEIEALWDEMLPEPGDMLTRKRSSRIFYRNRYFSYPLKPLEALFGLGIFESLHCGLSYFKARLFPIANPKNFEEWVSNQFGVRLFSIFFKTYTEKVWGMPCTEISADWAAQRIKGLSLSKAVWNAFSSAIPFTNKRVVKTLISSFRYPRQGPGMLWTSCAAKVLDQGGEIRMGRVVTGLKYEAQHWHVTTIGPSGEPEMIEASHVICSAALRDVAEMVTPALSPEAMRSALALRYRDFITVAVILKDAREFEDQWLYIHDPNVEVGRIQNFKAWSPGMVPDPSLSCYGMEYFCFSREDGLWTKTDLELTNLAVQELEKLNLCERDQVLEARVVRQQKAYPVYDEGYSDHIDVVRRELERSYPGLFLVGRNGMHKYNNQDHSMMTAILCVENILRNEIKFNLWNINEDAAYGESEEIDYSVSGLRSVPQPINKKIT